MVVKCVSRFLRLVADCILGEKWNATLTDSQRECKNLFKGAKSNIRIVTGDLQHDLFENEQILSILEDLSTRAEAPAGRAG